MSHQHLERIELLCPALRAPALELIAKAERDLHRRLLVVRTWSSYAEQFELYKQGRAVNVYGTWMVEDPLKVITKAAPGQSAHNVVDAAGLPASMALDVIPLTEEGTADWGVSDAFWRALYPLAWMCGLDPLGDRIGAYLSFDKGHFEEPAWKLKLDSWQTYRLP